MVNTVVLIILTIVVIWSIAGFWWFRSLYQRNPAHNETKKEVMTGGPFIWLLSICISVYNFFTIKK